MGAQSSGKSLIAMARIASNNTAPLFHADAIRSGGYREAYLFGSSRSSCPLLCRCRAKRPGYPPTPQADSAVPGAAPGTVPFTAGEGYPFERWLDMKAVSFSLRYRNVSDTDGVHEYEQGSQRTIADGALSSIRRAITPWPSTSRPVTILTGPTPTSSRRTR